MSKSYAFGPGAIALLKVTRVHATSVLGVAELARPPRRRPRPRSPGRSPACCRRTTADTPGRRWRSSACRRSWSAASPLCRTVRRPRRRGRRRLLGRAGRESGDEGGRDRDHEGGSSPGHVGQLREVKVNVHRVPYHTGREFGHSTHGAPSRRAVNRIRDPRVILLCEPTPCRVPEPHARQPNTEWDADQAVTHLFGAHYRPMVRLAGLLLHERGLAEEIVQDAYVRLHARWHRLRDTDKAAGLPAGHRGQRLPVAPRHRKVVDAHLAASRRRPTCRVPRPARSTCSPRRRW